MRCARATRVAAYTAFILGALISAAVAAEKRTVVDSAGRRVEVPARIARVFVAGGPASVFVYTLAPEKLLGWNRPLTPEERAYIPSRYANLPTLGRLTGRGILQLLAPLAGTIAIDAEAIERWPRQRLAPRLWLRAASAARPFPVHGSRCRSHGPDGTYRSFRNAFRARPRGRRTDARSTWHWSPRGPAIHRGQRRRATNHACRPGARQEPKILVMDEPTASLDFGNQVRVLSEIKALASRGIAVILSTHDPDQAFLCAHRVAILHNGRLAHLGPPQEVITSENLRDIYGVDVEVWPVEGGSRETLRVCVPSLAQSNRQDVNGKLLA
jgi:iron complex transport system ATP-binding protein